MKPNALETYTSIQLIMLRNERNAAQIDKELDRRNSQAARKLAPRRKITYKMIDYDTQKDD